jgi:hypothetical protein
LTKAELLEFYSGSYSSINSRTSRLKLLYDYNSNFVNTAFARAANKTPTSLLNFLTLTRNIQRQQTITEEVKKDPTTQSANFSTNLPPTIKQSDNNQIVSEEAQAMMKIINRQANLEVVQNFIDIYMAPNNITDIVYRLGPVTGIKPNSVIDPLKNSPVVLKSPQTDKYGQMWTVANLKTEFQIQHLNTMGNITTKKIPYINLFFPPFLPKALASASIFDIAATLKQSEDDTTDYSNVKTYDPITNLISRPDYTYRQPAFKAVNDNIILLQFLMEQATGVVSTYMTDWDLSIYMQEGLINHNPRGDTLFWLLHRIYDDNPMGYNDDRALCFGVVNAAVSKIFSSCLLLWNPANHPYGRYYMQHELKGHPLYQYDVDLGRDVFISHYPRFYDEAIAGNITESMSFHDKVSLLDKKYAAMSGWTEWDMPFFKAFYTIAGDGLSDWDVARMGAEAKGFSQNELIEVNKNIAIESGGLGAMIGQTGGFLENGEPDPNHISYANAILSAGVATKGSESTSSGNLPGDNQSFKGKNKSKSGGTTTSNLNIAKKAAEGYTMAEDLLGNPNENSLDGDGGEAQPGQHKGGKKAGTTGIPQTAPTIYGGPHGAYLSPQTVQAYFEVKNAFLRNCPRVSGEMYNSFSNPNINAYAVGNDRYYYKGGPDGSVKFDPYDQSPQWAIHKLIRGESTFTWAQGYTLQEFSSIYQGELRAVSYCSAYPTFANCRAPTGAVPRWRGNIYYAWREFWQADAYWNRSYWWGSYYYYWNKYTQSYWGWNGWGWQWRCRVYTPYQTGYWDDRVYTSFKRTTLASFPSVKWRITQFNKPTATINISYVVAWWNWIWWWWRSWYVYPIYDVVYSYQIAYKLEFPEGGLEKNLNYAQNNFWARRTTAEMDVVRQLIGMGQRGNEPAGHSNSFVFCEATGQSLADRLTNGPKSMFRAKVDIKQYHTVTYYQQWYSWRHNCHRDWSWYWVPVIHNNTYIDVDLKNVEWFHSRLNYNSWSTKGNSDYTLNESWIPTSSYRRTATFLESIWPEYGELASILSSQGGAGQVVEYSRRTITGWGILSSIQGYSSDAKENQYDGNNPSLYLNFFGAPDSAKTRNIQISQLPRYALHVKHYDTAVKQDNDGNPFFIVGGTPKYTSYNGGNLPTNGSMPLDAYPYDAGLKKAIARMYTSATFYKNDDDTPYIISIDSCFRILANQALWQISFLRYIRDILLSDEYGVDFQSIYNVMESCVDGDILSVSDPASPDYDKESLFYRYWIEKAFTVFSKENWVYGKLNLRNAIEGRITALQSAVNTLMPLHTRAACDWTLNEVFDAFNTAALLQRIVVQKQDLDDFFMCYLNILYEFRKYYINKRMNKQDGTMWVLRQLESILPMVVENFNVENTLPTVEEIAKKNRGQYVIAAYDIQNTMAEKVKVMNNPLLPALQPDKLVRVYVKVDYNATKADYIRERDAGTNRVIEVWKPIYKTYIDRSGHEPVYQLVRPLVLQGKVFRGYANVPIDGHYYIESDERLKNENNEKFNTTLPKGDPKRKPIRNDIDLAHWEITWGNTQELTPIYFGAMTGFDSQKLIQAALTGKLNPETDGTIAVCAYKKDDDFWTVSIPQSMWPRQSGYINNLLLKLYRPPEAANTGEDEIEKITYVIAGVNAYSLWPITEKQAKLTTGNPSQEVIKAIQDKILTSEPFQI